jgi:hypothetical protein
MLIQLYSFFVLLQEFVFIDGAKRLEVRLTLSFLLSLIF